MHLLWFLIIGALTGWLARKLMRGQGFGLARDLVVEILGALVGGFLFGLLGISALGLLGSLGMAIAGVVVLLWLFTVFGKLSLLHSPI